MKWSALLLLMTFSMDAHASWSDWWLNQDQQAQRALDHGDAKQAAQLFSDPRRRAYAESKAGRYADAAKQLAGFDDAQSQYNRGNALAYSGDLQNALSAYDAALKQTPADSTLHRDAQHNRDLVAKQLQQKQNQSQQSKGGNDKNQQNKQSKDNQKENQQQKNSAGSSSSGSSDSGNNQNRDKSNKGNSSSANAGNDNQNEKQNQKQGQRQAQQQAQQNKQPSAGNSGQSASTASGAQDKEQAQRDAQAAQAQQNHGRSNSSASSAQAMGMAQSSADNNAPHDQRAAVDMPVPPTEQSLAEQQWLRQIPDDPAGLVRRKFLIEHWLKQHGAQHENGN